METALFWSKSIQIDVEGNIATYAGGIRGYNMGYETLKMIKYRARDRFRLLVVTGLVDEKSALGGFMFLCVDSTSL